jgi:hypothetical protein
MSGVTIRIVLWCAVALALAVGPLPADNGPNHQVKQAPPVKMGTSGGSANDSSRAFCCGGTLGSLVSYKGVHHILSNNHVLARSGAATAGEDTLQPGLIDTGCNGSNSNIVGDFAGDIVPLGTKNVDAALSVVRSGQVDTSGAILDIGPPCDTIQNATVGLSVAKSGRTTGLTTGTVEATNVTVSVQYQRGCGSGRKFTITYTNQVAISDGSFSDPGDSGSLIVSNDGTPHPTALLYAGSSTTTIGNPIADVVSAFGGSASFGFVGNSCTSSASIWGATAAGPVPSENDLDFARVIKERHEPDLLARPGVLGVGVGADERDPGRAVIVVYLEAGRGLSRGMPEELDGVKVRVIPTDPFVAY